MITGLNPEYQAKAVNAKREVRIVKDVILQFGLPAAILVIVFSGAGRAGDTDRHAFANYGLEAKIQYCTDCHGSSGRGYHGFFLMPRLAGQPTEYLVKQLHAFAERRRGNTMPLRMSRVHGLNPSTRRAVASHFSHLNPGPFGMGPRALVASGKRIYEEGIPGANVPACSACHGPEAKGNGAEIPRLAGQLYGYTFKVLVNWGKEREQGPGNPSNIMKTVTQNMTRSQSAAVAAYLSHQK
jgi:cytochrome c553